MVRSLTLAATMALAACAGAGWAQEAGPEPTLEELNQQIAELEKQIADQCVASVGAEVPFVATTLRLLGTMTLDAGQLAELGGALADKLEDVAAICDPG